jgi:hypothetical protein
MTYGGTAPTTTASYAGFVNGDSVSSLTTPASCGPNVSPSTPAGSYQSTCSGAVDPNYTSTYAPGTVTVNPAPLVVTGNSVSRLFGASNPALNATLTGFVNGQNPATSGVFGQASCTTPAGPVSPIGAYAVTCIQGTLTSANYSFKFVPGVLSVTSTTAVTSGTHSGPMTVATGQSLYLGPHATVSGPVTVQSGGSLEVEGATIAGPVRVVGGAVRICDSTLSGPLDVSSSTMPVIVGDDDGPAPCAGNTVTGPVNLNGNSAGVEFDGNTVTGPVTIAGTTGSLAAPDIGSVDTNANKVSGPFHVH